MTPEKTQRDRATSYIDRIVAINRQYGLGECDEERREQAVREVSEIFQRLTPAH